jgi:hypothetical protein
MQTRRIIDALADQTVGPTDFEVVVPEWLHGRDRRVPHAGHEADPASSHFSGKCHTGIARNTRLGLAIEPLVLFVDDDVVPQNDLVQQHLESREQAHGETVSSQEPMLTPPVRRYLNLPTSLLQ